MARSVSFEVYYMQNGRWQIHARYDANNRDEAIEEAKRLDSGAFKAACVVRESFDSATNNSSESVIYHTPTMKAKPPVSFITSGAQDGGKAPAGKARAAAAAPPGSAAANAAGEAKKRIAEAKKERETRLAKDKAAAKTTEKEAAGQPLAGLPAHRGGDEDVDVAQLTLRIALAFLAACLIGTAIGVIAFYSLRGLSAVGITFDRMINQILLMGSWVVGWGIAFFPMLKRALNSARARRRREAEADTPQPAKRRKSASQALAEASASLAADADALKPDKPAPEDKTPAEEAAAALDALAQDVLADLDGGARDADAEDTPLEQDIPEPLPEPDPMPEAEPEVSDPEPEPEPDPDPDADPEPESAASDDAPKTGPAAVKAGLAAMVREAQAMFGKLLSQDSYLRFGLILFLAGAAETFARRAGVAQRQLVELLSTEIENLGASKQHARGFAANIDEYLLDQRYFDMYAAGRAGALRLSKGTNEESGLERAVTVWRQPAEANQSAQTAQSLPESKHFDADPRKKAGGEETPLGFVAVLFTDIVNSTNLQQTNGDKWMMNVVRAHNDIVRESLQRFGGQEIKHTGDGIMASFPDVVAAAEGALAMQDGFARFSEMMPDLAFEVRVGLSAGEPIHESGDIFGTPVNLAARVMSKAGARQIAVSGNVQEMCQDRAMKFVELGRFQLKGFPDPQPVYRLTRPRKRPRDDQAGKRAAEAAG